MRRTDQQAGGNPGEGDVPEGRFVRLLTGQVRRGLRASSWIQQQEVTGGLNRSAFGRVELVKSEGAYEGKEEA